MRDLLHETRALLTQGCERLRECYGVRNIAIFGSVARGETASMSDLDLLVDMDSPTFDRYMDLTFELEDQLGITVDFVLTESLKDRLADSIRREAVYV